MAVGAAPQRGLPTYSWPTYALPEAPTSGVTGIAPDFDEAIYIINTSVSPTMQVNTAGGASAIVITSSSREDMAKTLSADTYTSTTSSSSVEVVRTGSEVVITE